ncbi:transposase [Paraflavitalea speifideaquila]|uniref:transposase n=1 Tax=Paraflavitalea speifideaquila TaxID=3076558 RepID=UPI0028E4082D|nr:transposase [Paraflavitalea speifideiaquila]
MSLSHRGQITKIDDGRETVLNIKFGVTRVAIFDQPEKWYNAVVIIGFGEEPMILITNRQINTRESKAIYRIVEIYLTRWKCEECYRYIKQSYNLEDVRGRRYNAIRNITAIINAIAYFTSIYMGHSVKLKIMVQKIFILSKRFFGIPTFFNYAMADGIAELLKKDNIALHGVNYKGKTGISADAIQLDLYPN